MRARLAPPARVFALASAALFAAAVPGSAHLQESDPARAARWMDDLMWGRGQVGGPFALIDHTGRKRTDVEFRGRLLMVYFGYTTCPDICPADLIQMSRAIDLLGERGTEVQPIFISLDPERDTTEVLARYVSVFHPRLIGLTGTPQQVRAVADSYKAYYARYLAPDARGYLIDHSRFIYLVGRDGHYLGCFPPGTSADRLLEVVGSHLVQR